MSKNTATRFIIEHCPAENSFHSNVFFVPEHTYLTGIYIRRHFFTAAGEANHMLC